MKWSPHLLTRDFTLVWWGQMVSQIGDGVSKLALLWLSTPLPAPPQDDDDRAAADPTAHFVGPFIGVIVDRVPKNSC